MFTSRDSLARFKPRQRRILIWGGVVFGVTFVYLWIFGIAAWFVVVERRNLADKDDPALWKTPTVLKDLSASKAPGRKLSYFGYEFEVPWDDLDEERTGTSGSYEGIQFRSGKTIIFAKLPAITPAEQNKLHRGGLFDDGSLQSDYAFTRAALETTPGDVTLFTPSGKAIRNMVRLLLKSTLIAANSPGSGTLLIQAKDFRGFQYGDPDRRPRVIEDDLYSDKARLHFVFLQKSDGAAISQPEINRVIQSVRAVRN